MSLNVWNLISARACHLLFNNVAYPSTRAVLSLIVSTVVRRVKFSLLKFPSFPPCCFGCMTVEGHCFSLTRGQKAEWKGLLSYTESNHTLAHNVTYNVMQNKVRVVSDMTFSLLAPFNEGKKVGHNIWKVSIYFSCFTKSVRAWRKWNQWSELKLNITKAMPPTHTNTPSATKYSQENEFHSSYYISNNASV